MRTVLTPEFLTIPKKIGPGQGPRGSLGGGSGGQSNCVRRRSVPNMNDMMNCRSDGHHTRQRKSLFLQFNDFPRIHDVVGIEGAFQAAHDVEGVAVLGFQVLNFAEANAMLAGAGAAHGLRARDQAAVKFVGDFQIAVAVIGTDEKSDVEIAVSDMADDGRNDSGVIDIFLGFKDTVGKPRDRHAYIGGERLTAGL